MVGLEYETAVFRRTFEMIDWHLRAENFGTCNCDHACPCQFEGDPTHHACQAFDTFRILEGHFGDVDLAGVVAGNIYVWPGPVYEGGGTMQTFVDENASAEQADAIVRLLHGEETREASNAWWVFHAMCDTVLDTRIVPIEFAIDIESRKARVEIPGIVSAVGEPITNPLDGGAHRVQLGHPEGIEFDVAEIGNSRTRTTGDILLNFENTYAQFHYVDFNQNGPLHNQAA